VIDAAPGVTRIPPTTQGLVRAQMGWPFYSRAVMAWPGVATLGSAG
jgi:hypothetical protein